jgi:hypothetical protein
MSRFFYSRGDCVRLLLALQFMCAFALPENACANAEVRPAWRHASAPCRICFYRGADAFILTQVPVHLTNSFVAAVAAFSGENELKSDVIFNDGRNLSVLIDATPAAKRARVDLYLIAGDKPAEASAQPLREPAPLHGTVGRTAGMDYPRTRQEADSLTTRFDRGLKRFEVAGFDDLGGTFKEWYRGDWRRKSHLVDLKSWILVPQAGRYIFGLAGTAPAWLDVGGSQVVEHPAYQPFDKWTAGEPVPLSAGLHPLLVRTVRREKIDAGAAWKREGEEGVAADVVMITGVDLSRGRVEWPARNVHPFFTGASGEAYRFSGTDALFVPWTFENGSVCWAGKYDLHWQVAGADAGGGGELAVTVASVNLPAQVTLTLTAAESGESEQYTEVFDYDGPVWKEFAITSRMSGIPAACYEDDKVHPIIRVRSSAGDDLDYLIESRIELLSGRTITRSDPLRTAQGWGRQYLDQLSAGNIRSIAWSLKHCGSELSAGRVLFQRDPFAVVPDSVSGELFKKDDDFVVLVVSRRSAEREVTARRSPAGEGVLFMDGFVFDGQCWSRPVHSGVSSEAWDWQSVSALERTPNRTGLSLLQSFVKVPEALLAGTVILAPTLDAIVNEGSAEGFERRLAAMCGLLTRSGDGSPRVILVAPPPFDALPGSGGKTHDAPSESAPDARGVAEIILRVADVYGVETVDLFTAFEIARAAGERSAPLIDGAELTAAGRELAMEIIARKLGG